MSPQRVTLAWMLALAPVVIPIPGASLPESITDSAQAPDLALTPRSCPPLRRLTPRHELPPHRRLTRRQPVDVPLRSLQRPFWYIHGLRPLPFRVRLLRMRAAGRVRRPQGANRPRGGRTARRGGAAASAPTSSPGPSSRITAGTSSTRTMVASTISATIIPTPISLMNMIPDAENAPITMISSSARLVISPPVRCSPLATAAVLSPVRS